MQLIGLVETETKKSYREDVQPNPVVKKELHKFNILRIGWAEGRLSVNKFSAKLPDITTDCQTCTVK